MFMIIGPNKYYFVSPTLANLGWTYGTYNGEDALSVFVAEAHKHNLELFIDLQVLAYKGLNPDNPNIPEGDPPTADDVASIVAELADYGVDGISEEMFLEEWFEPVYQVCQQKGIVYIHKAINWDFGAMSHYWNKTVFQVYPNCDVIMTEDYDMTVEPPNMAALEQFPSIAKLLGKEYWMKASPDDWALRSVSNMENVVLLKAIQFKPRYIFTMIYSGTQLNDFGLAEMTNLIREHLPDEEEKPLCNIVLYLTGDVAPDTWNWWRFPIQLAAISTGIKASGYDILTTNEPIDNADMYYIYTRGKWYWGEALDLPENIVQLFDSGKPIFLQVAEILPASTPNWQTVRGKLGIDNTVFGDVIRDDTTPLSQFGVFGGMQYAHFGEGSYMNQITPENVIDGEIISTCDDNGQTYVLMVRKDNNYFINGSYLHIQASFPISNSINDGLQKPGNCVATAGNLSVFYALDIDKELLEENPLHIKLPNPLTSQISWFKRDFNGVTSSGITSYDSKAGYTDTLTDGTILILKTTATSPAMADVSGNGDLSAYDAALILQWLVGFIDRFPCCPDIVSPAFPVHADASKDGTLSAFDASLILQYLVGLKDSFPDEGSFAPPLISPDYQVSIPDLPSRSGKRITTPININVADGISAGEFILNFNPAILKPLDVSTTSLTSEYSLEKNIRAKELKISFAGANILKGSGALVKVEFEVLNGNQTTLEQVLTLTRARLNEKTIVKGFADTTITNPAQTALCQNFPNPFNPETWIPYQLAKQAEVTINIYNAKGQLIRVINVGKKSAGSYNTKESSAYWNGRTQTNESASSGIYFYTIRAGNFTSTRRMILIK